MRCGAQGDFKDGHLFHSYTDTAGQIARYADGRNNPEESVVPVTPAYKYPGWLLTAAIASRVCCGACTDPGRPVQYDNGVMGSLFDSLRCASIWTQEQKREFDDAGVTIAINTAAVRARQRFCIQCSFDRFTDWLLNTKSDAIMA